MLRIRRSVMAVVAAGAMALGTAGTASAGTASSGDASGQVFQNTNPAGPNAVQVYRRQADGTLVAGALVPTGGTGTGASLGNQGGVVRSGRLLFVVNAGDDTVTSFAITARGLVRRDVAPSGGDLPVSITVHDGLLYVLNAGDDSLSGLRVTGRGAMTPIPGSRRALDGTGVGAAQVGFDADGDTLVVTEKNANQIETFRVRSGGLLGDGTKTPSVGAVPFGFDVDARDHVVVSEAAPGALSSYRVTGRGLRVVTAGLPDTQAAACWVEITRDGRFAFTTNAASASVSAYRIARDGSLTLVRAVAASTGAGPSDMAESADGAYLFVRVRSGAVESYAIGADGSLTFRGSASGAAAFGTSGLAAV